MKKASVIRAFGKVLFLLYVGFLIYFLFVAEWYGRTEIAEDYRYNLELFKEIRRFHHIQRTAWHIYGICQSVREYTYFCPVWLFYFYGKQVERLF